MSKTVATVTDADFQEFTSSSGVALVDFWAPWCGPCKRVAPVIEQLAGEMPDVRFGKLNTDENQDTAAAQGIMSIPTLRIYKDGQQVDEVIGAQPKPAIAAALSKHL